MTDLLAPPPRERRSGALFGVVTGFLLGALVAALAVPDHGTITVRRTTGEVSAAAPTAPGDTTVADTSDGVAAYPDSAPAAGGAAAPADGEMPPGRATARPGGAATASGAGAPATGPMGGATARGVTENRIVLGVAYPDLGALRALGPKYDNGDVPAQWRALVASWRKDGRLPVAGRDIELRFASYQVTDLVDQRRACAALVNDHKVFAVVGVAYFSVGAECVAREYRTPLLTSDGPLDSAFARSAPFLFSLGMSESRLWRNFVRWADAKGKLRGRKVGVYYLNDPTEREIVQQIVKPELAKLGHKLAAEVTTDQSLGGPQDAVAVQRFRSAGVDVAVLLTSKAGFMQQATAQGYEPEYLDNDHAFGTSDTAASTYPPQQFDGALGFSGRRVGESAAGRPLSKEQEACLAAYERESGDRVERPKGSDETAEFSYVLMGCDLGTVLLGGLRAAGAALTPDSFVKGIETLTRVPLLRYATASYGPGKHHGSDFAQTVQWRASCRCWVSVSGFEPLAVP